MINKSNNQASHPTTEEIPALKISNTHFTFNDLRVGSTIADTFTISNAGGGVLNGSIETNKKWLKVFQSDIDTTQKIQDVPFQVYTSGLAFGFKDTGTIEIKSNAGIEKVNVTISVEAETIALLRKEINIPVIAVIGVLGVAIAVTVFAWQMALKTEKEAKLVKLKTEQKQAQQTNQEKHEYTTAQQNTYTLEQSATSQKESNSCIATVAPDQWKGEYCNNKNLQGNPSMVRDDGNGFIDFDWGNKGPCDSCDIGKDNFSVRWTRTVSFDEGTYRFVVTCDKDCRLFFYVDNELLYVRYSSQSPSLYSKDVPLATGKHIIKLEYYKYAGDSSVKLSWQKVSTPEQPTTQSPVTYNLTGDWEGKVYDKRATLKITQNGNNLSGNIVFGDVEEYLSGEVNNDRIVLKGTGYKLKKDVNFSLDTFQGIVSKNGNSINGNCADEDGHSGKWFVKRKSTTITHKSVPDQSKNQDNYKPEKAIQSSQAKLTKAMQKTPAFQIKHKRKNYPNSKMYSTVDDAKVKFLDNDSLEIRIKVDRVTINCTWSPKDYAYVGTWRRDTLERGPVSKLLLEKRHDDRRMQGKIKLFPRFNSNNEIMCFYGYIMSYNAYIWQVGWSYGNDYQGTPIKIAPTFWCLCPDPEGD